MSQRPLSPGGLIPVWMAKMAAHRAVPTQIERLEQVGREIAQQKLVQPHDVTEPWRGIKVTYLPQPTITSN